MKTTHNLLLSLNLLLLAGCASVTTELTVIDKDGASRTTITKAREFFDAKNNLTKWKTSNTEKSQSTGLEGLDASATGTNVVEGLKYVDSIVGKLAK